MSLKSDIIEVLPDLYQIRIPIPIRSLGYVFSYFARDGKHNLLIDAGWPSNEAFGKLESSLFEIGVSLNEIEATAISHLHPDHFGLAEQIRDAAPNSKLMIHEADAAMIFDSYEDYEPFLTELHSWLRENGTPEKELEAMLDASASMLGFFRPPRPTNILRGGEKLQVGDKWSFEVIPTPGHTIGTICLYDRGSRVMFTGDHILPTITPNISLGPYYNGDPLGDYLNSLDRVNKLESNLVLPSHEHVFTDFHGRVAEIKEHHEERLQDAISALAKDGEESLVSGYEVASRLKWYSGSWEKLGSWERRAAIMETLAHLEYLKRNGRIVEVAEVDSGIRKVRYSLVGKSC